MCGLAPDDHTSMPCLCLPVCLVVGACVVSVRDGKTFTRVLHIVIFRVNITGTEFFQNFGQDESVAASMLPASVELHSFENLVLLAEQQGAHAADSHALSFARVLKAIYTLRQGSNSYHLGADKRQARAGKRLLAHICAFVYQPKSTSSSHGLPLRA